MPCRSQNWSMLRQSSCASGCGRRRDVLREMARSPVRHLEIVAVVEKFGRVQPQLGGELPYKSQELDNDGANSFCLRRPIDLCHEIIAGGFNQPIRVLQLVRLVASNPD